MIDGLLRGLVTSVVVAIAAAGNIWLALLADVAFADPLGGSALLGLLFCLWSLMLGVVAMGAIRVWVRPIPRLAWSVPLFAPAVVLVRWAAGFVV
jgi:hypothetical protein